MVSSDISRREGSDRYLVEYESRSWLGVGGVEVPPVDGVTVQHLDDEVTYAQVKRAASPGALEALERARADGTNKRGNVLKAQSSASKARSALRFNEMVPLWTQPGMVPLAMTLTYGTVFPHPKQAKRDFEKLRKRVERYFGEPVKGPLGKLAYWHGLENQTKRGAPHLNAVIGVPEYLRDQVQEFIREAWIDVTGLCGSTRRDRERYGTFFYRKRSDEGWAERLVTYFTKEVHKGEQKQFDVEPGRWWGNSRLRDEERAVIAERHSVADLDLESAVDGKGGVTPNPYRRILADRQLALQRSVAASARLVRIVDKWTGEVTEKLCLKSWWLGAAARELVAVGNA